MPRPRTCSLAHHRRASLRAALALGSLFALALPACRSAAEPERTSPSSEPERFDFTLPAEFSKLELRGEGSESLRAPPGARVTRADGSFRVEAGESFALAIVDDAPPLSELAPASVARVLSEPDLAVFQAPQGYSFVVVRELVPEWDDGARQRLACGSAGGAVGAAVTAAPGRGFPKSAVEHMVAACRTLALPALE